MHGIVYHCMEYGFDPCTSRQQVKNIFLVRNIVSAVLTWLFPNRSAEEEHEVIDVVIL